MYFHTTAFEDYILAARVKPQLWRLLVGLGLFFAIYVGFVVGFTTLVAQLGWVGTTQADYDLNTRASLIEALLTFAGGILGVWAAVGFMHGRRFRTLLGPRHAVRRCFAIAAGVTFGFQAVWMIATSLYFGVVPNQPLTMVLLFFADRNGAAVNPNWRRGISVSWLYYATTSRTFCKPTDLAGPAVCGFWDDPL